MTKFLPLEVTPRDFMSLGKDAELALRMERFVESLNTDSRRGPILECTDDLLRLLHADPDNDDIPLVAELLRLQHKHFYAQEKPKGVIYDIRVSCREVFPDDPDRLTKNLIYETRVVTLFPSNLLVPNGYEAPSFSVTWKTSRPEMPIPMEAEPGSPAYERNEKERELVLAEMGL